MMNAIDTQKKAYRKLTLVPNEVLERLKQQQQQQQNVLPQKETKMQEEVVLATPKEAAAALQPNASTTADPAEISRLNRLTLAQFRTVSTKDMNEIERQFPRGSSMRKCAKILMEHLVGRVHVNDQLHIIYPDLSVGSYLPELIRYSVSVPDSQQRSNGTNNGNVDIAAATTTTTIEDQPADVGKFAAFMQKLTIPATCIPNLMLYQQRKQRLINNDGSSGLVGHSTLPQTQPQIKPAVNLKIKSRHKNLNIKQKLKKNTAKKRLFHWLS